MLQIATDRNVCVTYHTFIMKKTIVLFVGLIFASISVSTVEAQSKRNYVLETRDISNFDELNIDGGFTVHLMSSEEPFLEIEAHKNDVDYIKVSVKNGRLYISQKNKVKKIKPITLHIGFQELDKINLQGGINLSSDVPLKSETLDLEVAGGINIDLEINTSYLNIEAEGGVNLAICGIAEKADVELIGAGNLNAFCLATNEMDLKIEGAGKANVNVVDNLEISAEGVATVRYKGNPDVKKDVQGIVSVRRVED